MKEIFEWNRILYNDLPENFILEVLFRSTVMFIILLLTLKLAGKRGVKQLSVFETVIIIALGIPCFMKMSELCLPEQFFWQ